jgi:hypothetical protein
MKYQVWAWNGRYLRGNKVGGEVKTLLQATQIAKNLPDFKSLSTPKPNSSMIFILGEGVTIGLIETIEE